MDKYKNYIVDNILHILIVGDIDEYNGDEIAQIVFNAQADPEIKEIWLHINSGGGSIIRGLSLVGAIYDSGKPVITINEGAALSMAAIIFVAGHRRLMRDYAKLMLHNPSIWGQEATEFPEGSKERRALESLKDTLTRILEKNSNLTQEKLNELLDKETWLTAEEALEYGFIDEILQSEEKPEEQDLSKFINACTSMVLNQFEQLVKPQKAKVVNPSDQAKNQTEIKPKIQNLMFEKIKDLFGLPENANEADVLERAIQLQNQIKEKDRAVNELQEAVKAKETEIKTLSDKVKTLEASIEAKNAEIKAYQEEISGYRKKLAEQLVDSAIEAGKIKADKKAEMVDFAERDPEGFKAMLEAIPEKPAKPADIKEKIVTEPKNEDRSNWTYEDWSKNDPQGLRELMHKDPERFNNLLQEYIKTKTQKR